MKKRYILFIIISVIILIVLSYFIYNRMHSKNLQKDCEIKGGIWTYGDSPLIGKGFYYCNFPVKDEGKWCNDSHQCESGACAVPDDISGEQLYNVSNGTCTGNPVYSGYYLEGGKVVRIEVD